MRVNFHGKLRSLYGDHVTMQATSIADALEGFSRQQPDWPRDLRVVVAGYDTPDKLEECPSEIDVMPALAGGGGKFGSILMGAALVGIALIPGIGTAVSTSLLISGGLMAAQGVIGLFLKAPTVKSVADPEASKYLGINDNTTEVGTIITAAWGRIDLSPHWLSLQSDSNNLSHGVFPASPS